MAEELARKLQSVLDHEELHLREVAEDKTTERPKPGAWSKKEELGHLIDSAVNNHVRFVVASLQDRYQGPTYQQDGWVLAHGYHEMEWGTIIDLWEQHNALLVDVIRRIPDAKLATPCVVGQSEAVGLGFLIEDYVLHMQHHLDHVLEREVITKYPSQA